ncbi:hypothetical protein [Pedobacter agri]|uniref:Uncharacterized protein n=1 Tax=Pedobacter agri TaxID=454586 RepID=A0A9X3DBE4_9SPHI|nr:hypothetical protein [Pedobacter agri]MCX3264219.1 hypothetical protein [Pedobacter agri]
MSKDKLFHRQVNPNFVTNKIISVQAFQPIGEITSQVFKPKKTDEGLLSVYNNDEFTPEASFHHFRSIGFETSGTVSVSEDECSAISLDVIEDNIPFIGHASINMSKETTSSMEKKAKQLKKIALARGWTFGPHTI